jgi:hypothetical protein
VEIEIEGVDGFIFTIGIIAGVGEAGEGVTCPGVAGVRV